MKSPYTVVKSLYVTEKARLMEQLHTLESNPCIKKCDTPKYVFLVDKKATKHEIAEAVELIYAEKGIRVISVNTITTKPKKRRLRGREGFKAGFKKAIVTLQPGDTIEEKA
jgi:large subunit ribosomal protein L23